MAASNHGAGLLPAFVLLVTACAVGYAALAREPTPDPHYLKARAHVDRYERITAVAQRNYLDPAYACALDELDLVDPASISADAADALAREIRDAIFEYRQRLLRQLEDARATRQVRRARHAELIQRQELLSGTDSGAAARLLAEGVGPECIH